MGGDSTTARSGAQGGFNGPDEGHCVGECSPQYGEQFVEGSTGEQIVGGFVVGLGATGARHVTRGVSQDEGDDEHDAGKAVRLLRQGAEDGITPEEHVAIREADAQMVATLFSLRSDNSFISAPPPGNGTKMGTKQVTIALEKSEFFLSEISFLGCGTTSRANYERSSGVLGTTPRRSASGESVEILSCCNERSAPTALHRTLTPQLIWPTCTELDDDNIYLPSSGNYLVIDVTDITLRDPIIRRAEVGEEEELDEEEEREDANEEEESEATSNDPNYHESKEDGSEESGSDESDSFGGRSGEPSVMDGAMYEGKAMILVREGGKLIGIEGSHGAGDRGAKILVTFARGDYARNHTIYLDIVVISPCRAEEEDVEGESGYNGASGGVRDDGDTEMGRIELVEEGRGKGCQLEGNGGRPVI
ncbi:hypothetical protein CBR_g30821 [Chara braunii]|uniref:Uncharacterized protein n=1 Tax=Chara braunii TaxID=69332 RepID=A0A388JXQ7_CHABU|nr:hypothetical protein CBR_g30821 [Chara braunii]|eukprot:GBG62503.1 hypothetical protein CBR_g30821 [Chara braunii]